MPSAADSYTWKCLPEAAALFKKHLSDHSIGAYQKLCQYVGKQFEAVKHNPEGSHWDIFVGMAAPGSALYTTTRPIAIDECSCCALGNLHSIEFCTNSFILTRR